MSTHLTQPPSNPSVAPRGASRVNQPARLQLEKLSPFFSVRRQSMPVPSSRRHFLQSISAGTIAFGVSSAATAQTETKMEKPIQGFEKSTVNADLYKDYQPLS